MSILLSKAPPQRAERICGERTKKNKKSDKNQAKWTKRDKKREIKCKKSRKRKKGLTKRVKSDKINKSPRERAIKEKAKRR